MNIYRFLPYDPQFPHLFAAEKDRLQTHLTEAAAIEHFGSTSVPGLGGKGIIDIYVLVGRELLYQVSGKIQTLGYEYSADGGVVDERLFHRRVTGDAGNPRIYHLHLAYEGYYDFDLCLAFRDYLRSHPEAVQQYAAAKQQAAQAAAQHEERRARQMAYSDTKAPTLRAILAKLPPEVPKPPAAAAA